MIHKVRKQDILSKEKHICIFSSSSLFKLEAGQLDTEQPGVRCRAAGGRVREDVLIEAEQEMCRFNTRKAKRAVN